MDRRTILSSEQAVESFPSLTEYIQKSGADYVEVIAKDNGDGSYDIGVGAPEDVMVALPLPSYVGEQVAVNGGVSVPYLHITLSYLGPLTSLSLGQQRLLIGTVGQVCMDQDGLSGNLVGTGRFVSGGEEDAYWVGVDIPGLGEFQTKLANALKDAGLPVVEDYEEYTPHVTVAYLPAGSPTPPITFAPIHVNLDDVGVYIGGQRITFDLFEATELADPYYSAPSGWVPEIINKSIETVEEDRYTLAPFYVPGKLDAHGEWADISGIEKAFWGYMGKGDGDIRLQHNRDIVAGHRVDGVVWPFEVTVPLKKADGTMTEHTFPAGTPWLGVKWEPYAWELVKEGKLNGYSMGGSASMLEVDFRE